MPCSFVYNRSFVPEVPGIEPKKPATDRASKAFKLVGAATMLGSSVLAVAEARAIELTGAWATQADLCNQVFTKKDNGVAYAEFSELFGSGFIVDGDRIRGKS